jgi:hypothetical protein
MITRDTSACTSTRTAKGFSGNWLKFSCNVVLGLVDSSGNSVSTYSSATYVTVTFVDLPDYTSKYYPTSGTYSFTGQDETVSGSYSSLYSAYSTTFPDPSSIAQQSIVMKIPVTPGTGHSTMDMGMVGVSINGVALYDNLAASTDNIFSEDGSFDQCQGHPSSGNGGTYHYHSEPYTISYDDNNVIGIMRDGYWIYGRKDNNGSYPGSMSALNSAATTSDIYKYGGHTGVDPDGTLGTGTWHYHLTEWKGCADETGGTKASDDGVTYDTHNSATNPSCSGTYVDAWFFTGHGNGGVFSTVPGSIGTQAPSQTTAGARYYYGSPGACTGCN